MKAAVERAYKPGCDSRWNMCSRAHGERPPKSRASRRRDARRRAMGEAMAAARVRPTRALRATAGPRRPAPRRAARTPRVPGFQFARSPPAPARPLPRPPVAPAEVAAGARN